MLEAIKQAQKAFSEDEVPIGCVIVKDGKVIARAHNTRNKSKSATSHAEIIAINKACKKLNDWRLNGCTLFVTVEPCPMCAGACYNSRVDAVVFGASDEKGGAFGGKIDLTNQNILNHKLNVVGGVLKQECNALIKKFFELKRK